jgi:hypothetical protein
MIVVSDTSPICYLLLINAIELLPQLYGKVAIPEVVRQELCHPKSPLMIQNWIQNPPAWLLIVGKFEEMEWTRRFGSWRTRGYFVG